MRKVILILLTTFPLLQAQAAKTDLLTINPIVGYERVQKTQPTPHTSSRLIYGIGAKYGPPILKVEGEITRGSDSESYPDQDLTIKETATNLMLGIHSTFNSGSFLSWYLRGGGHARKVDQERTQNDVTTESDPAVYLSPYAGSGITLNLFDKVSINGGITVIFIGHPKATDLEYQTTFGVSQKF